MTTHILVVEDNSLVTGALRVLFEATGHRFSAAATVEEAVRVCLEDDPDVMLLDFSLPDGNGLEVLERLQARGAVAPITLLMTGRDDPALTSRGHALGCREILLKPVTPRVLLAKIAQCRQGSA